MAQVGQGEKKGQEVRGDGRPVEGVQAPPRLNGGWGPAIAVLWSEGSPRRGDTGLRRLPPGATMPEETIDPGLLEQTKNQIRKLVAEIADLAESDIQPAEFYVEFLNRSVAAVAATGGAFWLMDGRGGLRLQYQVEFGATGPDGRPRQDGAARRAAGLHAPGVAGPDHPARRGDRGGAAGVQPDRIRADHRPADGGQAGRPACSRS